MKILLGNYMDRRQGNVIIKVLLDKYRNQLMDDENETRRLLKRGESNESLLRLSKRVLYD